MGKLNEGKRPAHVVILEAMKKVIADCKHRIVCDPGSFSPESLLPRHRFAVLAGILCQMVLPENQAGGIAFQLGTIISEGSACGLVGQSLGQLRERLVECSEGLRDEFDRNK